jgi:acetyl-CoA carboxylase biotin carboxyl carrier protein
MKIRLSKTPAQRGTVQVAAPMPMPTLLPAAPAPPLPAPPAAIAASADGDTSGQPESSKSKLLEVKSPMVGTFYAAPEPGSDPYVAEGTRIAKGQILCIIEAMKIMNEIESEFSGVVREVLVQDAHPVEYGQVLFRVDPNG